MKKLGFSLIVAVLLTCLTATAQNPGAAPDMNQLSQAMQSLFSAGTNAAPVVDFRELKALLPQDVAGMKRKSAGGEKNTAMGMTVSEAEGVYEDSEGGALTIKISDMGGMGSLMMMAQAGWAASEIDRESDDGYEKTTTYAGFKALEKYNATQKQGDIQIMVGKRFMVEINGNSVDMAKVKAAAEALDLKKLEGIKAPAQP